MVVCPTGDYDSSLLSFFFFLSHLKVLCVCFFFSQGPTTRHYVLLFYLSRSSFWLFPSELFRCPRHMDVPQGLSTNDCSSLLFFFLQILSCLDEPTITCHHPLLFYSMFPLVYPYSCLFWLYDQLRSHLLFI